MPAGRVEQRTALLAAGSYVLGSLVSGALAVAAGSLVAGSLRLTLPAER